MGDERDEPHLVGQTAGLIAMMSALVKTLPPSTRKRLLRQTHAEFDALLAAMAAASASGAQPEREGVEWMRDQFLKRIAEAESKQKGRKSLKTAEDARQATAMGKGSSTIEPQSSMNVDFEL
jgi:hypothetical protein